jgi:hypothetical protein
MMGKALAVAAGLALVAPLLVAVADDLPRAIAVRLK